MVVRNSQFYSSSRSFRRLTLEADSYEAFNEQVQKEFDEFQRSNKEKKGPVVCHFYSVEHTVTGSYARFSGNLAGTCKLLLELGQKF